MKQVTGWMINLHLCSLSPVDTLALREAANSPYIAYCVLFECHSMAFGANDDLFPFKLADGALAMKTPEKEV